MMAYHPVTFNVEYPDRLSRVLIFIKWLLVIPHLFVLWIYALIACICVFIAWWAILFSGRYPRGLFDFVVKYMRYSNNVSAYANFMRDEYPPFGA